MYVCLSSYLVKDVWFYFCFNGKYMLNFFSNIVISTNNFWLIEYLIYLAWNVGYLWHQGRRRLDLTLLQFEPWYCVIVKWYDFNAYIYQSERHWNHHFNGKCTYFTFTIKYCIEIHIKYVFQCFSLTTLQATMLYIRLWIWWNY